MLPSATRRDPAHDDLPADPAEEALRAGIREVMQGFSKVLRAHLLYEGTGMALDRFVEELRGRTAALWERTDAFNVVVDEQEVRWRDEAVFRDEDRVENLAFLLHRDGLRELTFLRGFEGEELETFVALLARVHRMREDEEDLLTLLWEEDWEHLRYRYVDPLDEGIDLPAASGGAPQPIEPVRPEPEPQVVSSVSRDDFEESLYFLDEGEMRRLREALDAEMRRPLWRDVLNALFDRLEDGSPERQERIVGILVDVLPVLLGAGRIAAAAGVLREVVAVATRPGALAPPAVRALRRLFEQLASPETVEELVRVLEDAGGTVPEEALRELVGFLPAAALEPLLRAAEGTPSSAVRRLLFGAAEGLAARSRERLAELAASPDAAVAAGAARLLGRLRAEGAAPTVAALLRRPEPALRVVAVEALREMRSSSAAGALEGALEDDEREVRIAAARALAALRYGPATPWLEAAVDSKRLREADVTERIAFFEAYGELAGGGAVPMLERMLNGKNWLGRRESGEMRACAALGLGRIRLPEAERALAAASADGDPVVRSAVGRALRGLRS